MIRNDYSRSETKRRGLIDHRKQHFAEAKYEKLSYPHRLNFYTTPPTEDISLEQFEQWAIDRLRGTSSSHFSEEKCKR